MRKSKDLRIIYNPHAGRRKAVGSLDAIIQTFQEGGHEVSVHRAGSPEDIETTAAKSSDVQTLVIAGGDGSIHHAVNGLMKIKESKRPALGILPVGTANDLAFALHLPRTILEACSVINQGRIFSMDLGVVNARYFVNVASAGLLTDVSQKVDVRVKNVLGQLAYYLKGLESIPSFRPFKLEYKLESEHHQEEVMLLLAVNGLSVGGLRQLMPRASLSDGKLDILLVRQSGWPEVVRILFSLLRGEKDASGKIEQFQTEEIIVQTDRPLTSDLDGECGSESPWHIRIGPKISVFH
ncbi:MAG: diacylglycerol/lipid kinase family protein [Desulfitobacteriaceae bacterium]